MTAVIMQPTFLPWIGYFNLIDQADTFVFLDNVQFEKQSWQQRNRVRTASGLEWITVPVFIKGKFGQTIDQVKIKTMQFPEKHLRTLAQHYSRAPYFNDYWSEIEKVFHKTEINDSLRDLNISLIKLMAEFLGISATYRLSSEFPVAEKRSSRLVYILQQLKEREYLSPAGSADYLKQDRHLFDAGHISVKLQQFEAPEYQQRYFPFVQGATALDMLFNLGGDMTRNLMRQGSRPSAILEQPVLEKADT